MAVRKPGKTGAIEDPSPNDIVDIWNLAETLVAILDHTIYKHTRVAN